MALTRQTMTDEQRKSVALEYLKAYDNGGVTSTGGSILDLFAERRAGLLPEVGPGQRQGRDRQALRRSRQPRQIDPPRLRRLQLDLHRHRPVRLRRHELRRACRRPLARGRARVGRRPLVRRVRGARLPDPALLHLPRSRLRRQGHGTLPMAEDMNLADIQQAAGLKTPIRHQLFIDGRFVDAESGETLATLNPHDNSTIADVALAGKADVDRAVAARRSAPSRPGAAWRRPIAAACC